MRGWGSQGSPWAWGTVSEVPASTVGGLPRWTVDTAAAEATGPSSCPPRPCLPIARASRVSTLPILSRPPPSSPSLLRTLAGLGSGADALPEARPSFLSSSRSVSLLGISVTQPREKVTFGLTLSTWLVETPTSCCARDGRLFCPPPPPGPNQIPNPATVISSIHTRLCSLGSQEGGLEEARLRFKSWLCIFPAV